MSRTLDCVEFMEMQERMWKAPFLTTGCFCPYCSVELIKHKYTDRLATHFYCENCKREFYLDE